MYIQSILVLPFLGLLPLSLPMALATFLHLTSLPCHPLCLSHLYVLIDLSTSAFKPLYTY